jgi:hypothetical protein
MNGLARTFLRDSELRLPTSKQALPETHVTAQLGPYEAIWAAPPLASKHGNHAAYELLRRHRPDTMLCCAYWAISLTRQADYGWYRWEPMLRHPEWFLERDEKWALYDADDKYPAYYVDVTNPEFRAFALAEMVAWVRGEKHEPLLAAPGLSFDALGADITCMGMGRMGHVVGGKVARVREDRVADWDRGMCLLLADLSSALNSLGKCVIANHTYDYRLDSWGSKDWTRLTDAVSGGGLMTENPLSERGKDTYFGGHDWLKAMRWHEQLTRAHGLRDWWVGYPKTEQEFWYLYCSYLLTYKPGLSLITLDWPSGESHPQGRRWHEAYDMMIGKPLGERKQFSTCFERHFENEALVIVNPTEFPARICRGEVMPPMSGRILQ